MPYDPFTRVRIGRTDVEVTRLGFGSASIGGLFRAVDDDQAIATVEHAWDLGIRYFDVAPLYGYGDRRAAARCGAARTDRATSTSCPPRSGASSVPPTAIPPGADIDHQALDGREDAYYADVADRRIVFDYSADGVTRSLEESLERLGLDRVDIAYIHDPDDHWQAAIDGAYPALHRLREQGVVGAIGVGMNQSAMLARFAREAEMDAFLVAGRYTLLDQDALAELLPLCVERGISRAHRRRDEQRRAGRPAAGRSLRLRPGEPRDPRTRPAARPRPAALEACPCVPPRSSSRWPIPPSPG